MRPQFEEIDYQQTPLGEMILRRRTMHTLGDKEIYEIMLGSDFLMSSLFTVVEEALSTLGIAATEKVFPDTALDVVVGGLGLGYTAKVALDHASVSSLTVVDYLQPVIDWHEQGLVPLGAELSEEHAGVFAIDDRLVAELGFGVDHQIDFLTWSVAGCLFAEIAVDSATGHDAIAIGVDVDVNDVAFSDFESARLLPEWGEQIFIEPPVEKGSDA